jgi:decaprenylphospho-beta-D-ribofuranose 2-oxidase
MVIFLKVFFSLKIMKLFNFLKFRLTIFNGKENLINYKKFFFPLDNILNWNAIYGNQGFLQYQFVISKKKIYEIIDKINELNLKPTLVVLKLFSKENKNFLSFPKKGITIAMDLFNSKKNISKLNILTKFLILNDGRVYLAKDSIINHKDFCKMYPNWKKFKKLKNRRFASIQSERLKI